MESSKNTAKDLISADDLLKLIIERMRGGQTLKTVYKKLSLEYHPDKNPNDPNASGNFKLLANLYDTWSKLQDYSKLSYEEQSKLFRDQEYKTFATSFAKLSPEDNKFVANTISQYLVAELKNAGQGTKAKFTQQKPKQKVDENAERKQAVYNDLKPEDKKLYRDIDHNAPTAPKDMKPGDILIFPITHPKNSGINLVALVKIDDEKSDYFYYGMHNGDLYHYDLKANKISSAIAIVVDVKERQMAPIYEKGILKLLTEYQEFSRITSPFINKIMEKSHHEKTIKTDKQKVLDKLEKFIFDARKEITNTKNVTPEQASQKISELYQILKSHLINVAVEAEIKHKDSPEKSKVGKFFAEKITSSSVKDNAVKLLKNLSTPDEFAAIKQKIADQVAARREFTATGFKR